MKHPGAEAPMTIRQLAALGWDELRAKFSKGELKREHLGLAADGGQAWLEALAGGDITTAEVAMARARTCLACPSHTRTPTELTIGGKPVVKVWCGEALEARTEPLPVCGCLMALLVGDELIPAPKCWVASGASTQAKWASAPRADSL